MEVTRRTLQIGDSTGQELTLPFNTIDNMWVSSLEDGIWKICSGGSVISPLGFQGFVSLSRPVSLAQNEDVRFIEDGKSGTYVLNEAVITYP